MDQVGGARWSTEEEAEIVSPLSDGRIPAADTETYLAEIAQVHRLATEFSGVSQGSDEAVERLRQDLSAQLRQDCETSWVWDRWGAALVREHGADQPTVTDEVLRWLERIESDARGVRPALPPGVHHAGALHTYGYLCSSLRTRYGWKRTRWVGGGIAAAAGVRPEVLRAVPPAGTLLSNATVLTGRLLGWPIPDADAWAPDIAPTARLIGRVVEIATAGSTRDGMTPLDQPVELHTSLYRPGDPPPNSSPNLLVYTTSIGGDERLVTLFDVSNDKVDALLEPPAADLGDEVPIRLRYNAWLPGCAYGLIGSRSIEVP